MTSSIPDGLSFAQLQELMATACIDEGEYKTLTPEAIGELVIPAVMSVREDIGDISAYKHVAMFALYKLFEFHNTAAMDQIKAANDEDSCEAALCWARDAGWLQVCLNTLRNVGCGPNDHFIDTDDQNEE